MFLERYSLLLFDYLDFDTGRAQQVISSAQQLCLHMQIKAEFLDFKPSEIAAAGLLTAIQIRHSRDQKLDPQDQLVRTAEYLHRITRESSAHDAEYPDAEGIDLNLFMTQFWTAEIEEMTLIKLVRDIVPVYTMLVHSMF